MLAYHAALIELIAIRQTIEFNFLILDTPKQHEIDSGDLDLYFRSLKELCQKYEIQVIFSTTEYHYIGNEDDVEWRPVFPGKKQSMFFQEMSN